MVMGQQQIADLEYQLSRSAIAHNDFVRRPQSVKRRNSNAQERHMKALGHLPAMRMRDQQIASPGAELKVFQVADQHVVRWNLFQQR